MKARARSGKPFFIRFLYLLGPSPLEFLCTQLPDIPAGNPCTRLDADQGCVFAQEVCWHSGEIIVRSIFMMDVVMVALAFAFFGLSIAYVYACEQL